MKQNMAFRLEKQRRPSLTLQELMEKIWIIRSSRSDDIGLLDRWLGDSSLWFTP